MKKQVFLRSLLGAFVGCFIGVVIIVCISLAIGGGDMHVATPALLAQVGSEVGAFSLQMAAAMLIGAIWSGASVIWEVERWSLLRQTLTHFLLCSVVCLPIAWAMDWMADQPGWYLFGFVAMYAGIWLINYLQIRRRVREILREHGAPFENGVHLVCVLRWRAVEASYADLERDWQKAARKLKLQLLSREKDNA